METLSGPDKVNKRINPNRNNLITMETKDLEEILKAQFPTQLNESTVEQVFSPMKMKIILAAMLHCYNLGKGEVEVNKPEFDKDNWCIDVRNLNIGHKQSVLEFINANRVRHSAFTINHINTWNFFGKLSGDIDFSPTSFAPVITFDQFKTLISK